MDFISDLDTPLLTLSATDKFTLRDAVQGVHMFGGIGSGKTSGSGKALASAYLRGGMGGLVLAAKPDEVALWLNYAKANGRANSVVLFGEAGGGFNFITYELARHGGEGLGSVVECLVRIMDAANSINPNAGRSPEPFWENTTKQILRNTLPVLYAATGSVRIPDIIRFVATAPQSVEQMRSQEWQDKSFMFAHLLRAQKSPAIQISHDREVHDDELEKASDFWHDEYSTIDSKTRSNIAISLSTVLDRFNRGRLNKAFCKSTTLVPEMTFHGAIIIMDMSALTWNEDGIIAQQLFKFMWQRAVLSRNGLAQKHRDRPVFLWADESQYFVNAYDSDYQSTCRSAKACTVYLTQSLPTYYAKIGGENAKAKADMLLGNFGTKIFHNNADPESNRWAADTIGRSLIRRHNYNEGQNSGRTMGRNIGGGTNWGVNTGTGSSGGSGGGTTSSNSGISYGGNENWGSNRGTSTGESQTEGWSETMDYEIEPGDFSRYLKTGGTANKGEVTAVWFQAGKRFNDSDRNYLYTRFKQ